MKKNKITSLIILVIFIILATVTLIFSKSHKQTNPISKTSFCFDTVITITIYDKAKETLLDDCLNLCDYYNNLFDCHLEGSDIYKINHSNGLPVTVSSKTIDLLNYACNYANLSNGSVDPTIGSVSSLWDFTTDDFSLPASSDISNAIIHVNYENIIIDNDQVYLKDPASSIDLGFIAKGYVADQLKSHLLSNGVQSGIINLGHNILLIGAKPDGSDFQIGIQNPYESEYAVACSSKDKGPVTMKACDTGCIGCRICEKNCPSDAVHVNDNVAQIEQEKCTACGTCQEKCPKKAILPLN